MEKTLSNGTREYIMIDGRECCPNCKTPNTFNHPQGMIWTHCECMTRADEEREFQRVFAIKKNDCLNYSLRLERFENETFETLAEKGFQNLEQAKKYVDNFAEKLKRGDGLYLVGGVGTGKTTVSCAIQNEIMEKYMEVCMFSSFYKANEMLNASYDTHDGKGRYYIERMKNVPLLVIDDFGIERFTRQGEETQVLSIVKDVVGSRYDRRKPIIFNSNMPLRNLSDMGLDARTIDRIRQTCEIIVFKGESKREAKGVAR